MRGKVDKTAGGWGGEKKEVMGSKDGSLRDVSRLPDMQCLSTCTFPCPSSPRLLLSPWQV